jgi:hypothetical protein
LRIFRSRSSGTYSGSIRCGPGVGAILEVNAEALPD